MNVRSILFLAANASYSHTNLAGGYLGAVADAAGWKWQTLETLADANKSELLSTLYRIRPKILATSLFLFNRHRVCSIIRRYKMLCPDCLVIGGGPEFDGDNREFLDAEPSFDVVVRGEGETAFGDWLHALEMRSPWGHIPGLCFREGRRRYHDGGRALPVQNLDHLPSPYRFLPDIRRKPFMQLETTRGCSNRCTFCREGSNDGLRMFALPRVQRELQHLRESGVREIRILDRTFNEPAARACRLLALFLDEFRDIRFHLEIDPGRLTPAFVKLLQRAPSGRCHLEAGIQTLDPGAWQRMRRGTSPQSALSGLRTLTAMPHLEVHADLIAGLPGVNRTALRADIDTLVAVGPSELQLETLKVLPGTSLRERATSQGLVYAPEPPWEALRTREMTPDDLTAASDWSRAIDWFYNTAPLRETTRTATGRWPDFWERAAEIVKQHGGGGMPSLRNRFLWLAELVAPAPELVDALRFEWMQLGLGERGGFIEPRPWHGAVPAAAEPVAGSEGGPAPAQGTVRRVWVRLERDYLFEYHTGSDGRRRTIAYRLPAGHDIQSVNQRTVAP